MADEKRIIGEAGNKFTGFERPDANFIYCPNQFFDVCLPHCSRGAARLVGYILYRTLRFRDENGVPCEENIPVPYNDLVEKAGTWIKKNERYLDHSSMSTDTLRPRVVPVTARSRERLDNILALFGMQNGVKHYNRQLYLGVYLEDFLAADNGITDCIFADHRKSGLPLIPPHMLDALPQGKNLSSTSPKCMLLPCLEDHVQAV